MIVWPIPAKYRRYVEAEMRAVFKRVEGDISLRPAGYSYVPAEMYDGNAEGDATYVVDCPADFMISLAEKK